MPIRNAFFLKPSPSLAAALRRMDARDEQYCAHLTAKRLKQLEHALARGPVSFTVKDAIRD